MIIYINMDGTSQVVEPSKLYQGTNNVTAITVLSPFPEQTALKIGFILPDGSEANFTANTQPATYAPMTPVGSIEDNGVTLQAYSYVLPANITAQAGTLQIAICAVFTSGEQTSYLANVEVERSVLPTLTNPPATDVYNDILRILNSLSGELDGAVSDISFVTTAGTNYQKLKITKTNGDIVYVDIGAGQPFVNAAFTTDAQGKNVLRLTRANGTVFNAYIPNLDTALLNSSTALSTANAAKINADNALSTANTALSTANQAKTTADGIDAKAQEALDTANEAKTTADAIDAKAQSALDTANTALTTANEAKSTADGIEATAQEALDTANEALAKADAQADATAFYNDSGANIKTATLTDDMNASTTREAIAPSVEAVKKAYANPNLLFNGAFKINTNGQTTYTAASTARQEAVDKWELQYNAGAKVSINSQYVELSDNANLLQYLPEELYKTLSGKTVTVSVYIAGNNTGVAPRIGLVWWNNGTYTLIDSVYGNTGTAAQTLTFTATMPDMSTATNCAIRIYNVRDTLTANQYVRYAWVKMEEGNLSTAPKGIENVADFALSDANGVPITKRLFAYRSISEVSSTLTSTSTINDLAAAMQTYSMVMAYVGGGTYPNMIPAGAQNYGVLYGVKIDANRAHFVYSYSNAPSEQTSREYFYNWTNNQTLASVMKWRQVDTILGEVQITQSTTVGNADRYTKFLDIPLISAWGSNSAIVEFYDDNYINTQMPAAIFNLTYYGNTATTSLFRCELLAGSATAANNIYAVYNAAAGANTTCTLYFKTSLSYEGAHIIVKRGISRSSTGAALGIAVAYNQTPQESLPVPTGYTSVCARDIMQALELPSLELGRRNGSANAPYIDFHTDGTTADFNSRIQATNNSTRYYNETTGEYGDEILAVDGAKWFSSSGGIGIVKAASTNISKRKSTGGTAIYRYGNSAQAPTIANGVIIENNGINNSVRFAIEDDAPSGALYSQRVTGASSGTQTLTPWVKYWGTPIDESGWVEGTVLGGEPKDGDNTLTLPSEGIYLIRAVNTPTDYNQSVGILDWHNPSSAPSTSTASSGAVLSKTWITVESLIKVYATTSGKLYYKIASANTSNGSIGFNTSVINFTLAYYKLA